MSFSDWYTKHAFGIACVVYAVVFLIPTYFVSQQISKQNVYQEYATQKAYSDARNKFEQNCTSLSVIKDIATCFENQIQEAREPQRAEEDLKAQKQMAKWALALLVVSSLLGFFSLVAAVAGVGFVWATLRETRRIGEAQVRAYLGVAEIVLIKPKVGDFLKVDISLKNSGQSPAYAVRAWCTVTTDPDILGKKGRAEETHFGHIESDGERQFPKNGQSQYRVTEKWFSVLSEGHPVYAFGEIHYVDAFNRPWTTEFRFRHSVKVNDGLAMLATPEGNRFTTT